MASRFKRPVPVTVNDVLEPLELLFGKVAGLVATPLTRRAFLRGWRLMSIDGFELDVPDTPRKQRR